MRGYKWTLGIVDRIRDAICVALLAALFILINIQVFYRYVINDPLSWPEEVARNLFVWITFLGVAKLFRERLHYAVDFFIERAPYRVRAVAAVLIDFSSIIFFIAVLSGAWPVLVANAGIRTSIELPINLLYASLPIATLLILPAILVALIEHVRAAVNGIPPVLPESKGTL